ncbi:MAG TPA: DNA-directed DNA polymerase II large subunit [Methanoregulaceae archaeon]|nr:DNA-directed DNA polymerase II large subunit [Methanoregulaceae archaeon]
MLRVSPAMENYLKSLQNGLEEAMRVARLAREQGIDPKTVPEIPVANDLADRVEALLDIKGIASRIRELEATMSREEVALRIGDDFVLRKFGETSSEEVLDHSIRTAMALLTEGVVAAPTEGIAKIGLGKNDDGTSYLRIFYAGPIRSAGGTAQALSVLVGDYVRRALEINRYIPRQEEIERYIEEIRQYNSIMNLQYLPSDKEIRLIVSNCPVCIDGEGTEREEVSGYRNLSRVETNTVRGGMALVLAEGLALKAPKVQKNVRKMKMDGWDWLDQLITGTPKSSDDEGNETGIKPKDKYLRDLIAGRPVFAYPMRKGGFRLRLGRSRNTGFAAAGLNPATMRILGNFLAVGTQMKTERPGKAAGIAPVDSIEGPTVRLKDGSVLRVDREEDALEIQPKIEKILDVGEILISFGEFLENNHPLVPSAYCEEWWLQEGGIKRPGSDAEALAQARTRGYLHPGFTYYWDDLTCLQIRTLADYIGEKGTISEDGLTIPVDFICKGILEEALVPHIVRDEQIVIRDYRVPLACLGLDQTLKKTVTWENAPDDNPFSLVMHLSGLKMRSKAGTRIGGRMGRPGKSAPRKMDPAVHVLFPLGEAGGSRRSFQEASSHAPVANKDGGVIIVEAGTRRCPSCGAMTLKNACECGAHTNPVFRCPKCGREGEEKECPACHLDIVCSAAYTINIRDEYAQAIQALGSRENQVQLVKGVKGMISREKAVEPVIKGVLRAQHELFVFKDGTVRYDMIDLPLTHFRPDETGVTVSQLNKLGYEKDLFGTPLLDPSQVVELRPQDILVSESCAEYLVKVARFIDSLLGKCYGLPPFYQVNSKSDLLGHLVMGLAPHTSAGVLARIVGFTKANVGYAHPFFHAAKRRNCFHGDTVIGIYDGKSWKDVPIRRFVMENFDLSHPGIDRLGTYYSDPAACCYTRAVDTNGIPHLRKITSVSVHKAPASLIRIETTRGKVIVVTPDHAMLVWDLGYLRKIKAMELKPGDPVPVDEGMNLISDRIKSCDPVPGPEDRVFCVTVADDHTVLANGIYTGQCDGDEDCIMLLLDGLINFSRSFLPETRGGSMDAPLVLTSRIDPAEIDKESHNLDVGAGYPLELYLAAVSYTQPRDVEHLVDRVERRLDTPAQMEGFFFTHPTSNISAGPLESTYTTLETMLEKLEAELKLAAEIRAVDQDDVAERVLNTHFIRDLMGNLTAFSRQKFRCTKCNTSYRRMPLAGKCNRCNGNIIATVHEGSVKKYLTMSQDICTNYKVSEYTRQRVEVLVMAIESTFGTAGDQQMGLADFM